MLQKYENKNWSMFSKRKERFDNQKKLKEKLNLKIKMKMKIKNLKKYCKIKITKNHRCTHIIDCR